MRLFDLRIYFNTNLIWWYSEARISKFQDIKYNIEIYHLQKHKEMLPLSILQTIRGTLCSLIVVVLLK